VFYAVSYCHSSQIGKDEKIISGERDIKEFFANYKMPLYGGILTAVFSGAAVYLLGNL